MQLISNDVSSVITKLNELDVVLNDCLEKDPNVTQETLISGSFAITDNFVGVLTNEELEEILTTPPGLLYGDYYLSLTFIPSDFSFTKKQVIAQNKESVPPPGKFFNPGIPVEKLLGDESFSSSNIVLVDEMKWLIDTKDLIFPPPPPAEDPLKAIFKQGQIAVLISIYGATEEEAEELYELAWELSQNRGPNKGYYDTLVKEAFDNSRTLLEQAVANEGYEWQQGDRILDSTIKNLFLPGVTEERLIDVYISQLRNRGELLFKKANNTGKNYDANGKRWSGEAEFRGIAKLEAYAERLALTAENNYNDNTIGSQFVSLRPEMKKRKRLMQAIFEEANYLSLQNPDISFNDPLGEYFRSKGNGYNTPIINGIPIIGSIANNTPITFDEVEQLWELEKDLQVEWWFNNLINNSNPLITPNGVTEQNRNAYAKTQLMLKLRTALGTQWYNTNAITTSELPFWYIDMSVNPNSPSANYNDPNRFLNSNNEWYFEFGRNGLPIPTG